MRGIAGIILAAGGSTRLGEPKQLLQLRADTLVHAAVCAAREGGCETVCVVTGHTREAVEDAVADLQPLAVHNAEWERGLGSSIRVGVTRVRSASAIVLLACDQPAVDAAVVRSLIERHEQTRRAIVASRYSGTIGIPALFTQACFGELLTLPDDRGAKAVIQAHPGRVSLVDFPGGAFDLDTREDLRAWRANTQVG